MMNDSCPRCASNKIIHRLPMLDRSGRYGNVTDQTGVEVHGNPEAWFFKGTAVGKLSIDVCGECGYAEMHVSNADELYEAYVKSRQQGG